MAPGYMIVLAEIGTTVTEDNFHDWYDNEHIPLRYDVPAFLTFQRWHAADGVKPTWAASYDLTCVEDLQKPPYTTLSETRSMRELLIFRDIEEVDMRVYDAYEGNDTLPQPSSLFDPSKAAPVTMFAFADVHPGMEGEYSKWCDEEHVPILSKVPGWIRSRRFLLRTFKRVGVEGNKDQTPAPKLLTVHEFTHAEDLLGPETRKAMDTPWRQKVVKDVLTTHQLRRWDLHKSFERK